MTDPAEPLRLFASSPAANRPRATDDHGHDVIRSRLARLDRTVTRTTSCSSASADTAPIHTLTPRSAPVAGLSRAALDSLDRLRVLERQRRRSSGGSFPVVALAPSQGCSRAALAYRLYCRHRNSSGQATDHPDRSRRPPSARRARGAGRHQHAHLLGSRARRDRRSTCAGTSHPATLDPFDRDAAAIGEAFSAEIRPGEEPRFGKRTFSARVVLTSPWKGAGSAVYTRFGRLGATCSFRTDDKFVIAAPGDSHRAQLSMPMRQAGRARRAGRARFLLKADGFSKEMDLNSATSSTRWRRCRSTACRAYPYAASERYPDTPAHNRYRERFNTRRVVKPLPTLAETPSRNKLFNGSICDLLRGWKSTRFAQSSSRSTQ